MGDVKAAAVASSTTASTTTTTTATPRTTYRRTNRFGGGGRTSVRSFAISRTPIVLEFDSQVVRLGYSEQSKPQHTLLLPNDTFSLQQNLTEMQWYNLLSPILLKVYDRLMCNPTSRRVVCLLPHLAPSNMIAALKQILWNKGVPAIVVWSNLEILPVALGWKRGLIVHVSKNETVSVCHADGHVLPFTYQNVPVGYDSLLVMVGDKKTTNQQQRLLSTTPMTAEIQQVLLNENNPNSMVFAILKTLEESPRDVRPFCASNICFSGEGSVLYPDLGRQVIQRIQTVLEGSSQTTPLDMPPAPAETETTETENNNDNATTTMFLLTSVPIHLDSLKPLAAPQSKLQLKSTYPHRPDWVAWVGASLWAAVWNKYDDEESPIQWDVAPTEN